MTTWRLNPDSPATEFMLLTISYPSVGPQPHPAAHGRGVSTESGSMRRFCTGDFGTRYSAGVVAVMASLESVQYETG